MHTRSMKRSLTEKSIQGGTCESFGILTSESSLKRSTCPGWWNPDSEEALETGQFPDHPSIAPTYPPTSISTRQVQRSVPMSRSSSLEDYEWTRTPGLGKHQHHPPPSPPPKKSAKEIQHRFYLCQILSTLTAISGLLMYEKCFRAWSQELAWNIQLCS